MISNRQSTTNWLKFVLPKMAPNDINTVAAPNSPTNRLSSDNFYVSSFPFFTKVAI